MNKKLICSTHIQKLGHEIQEIRERALFNIISKLDHGFIFDNGLSRSREILTKLFEWFRFEPCTQEEIVLRLIKRILESEYGQVLINHLGVSSFKQKINNIFKIVEPRHYKHLEDISEFLETFTVVPPLDLPLSSRTCLSFDGFIYQNTSPEQESACPKSATSQNSTNESLDYKQSDYLLNTLKWQTLIETDSHVLVTIENSLMTPPEPSSLLQSITFFCDVLLHDFPPEVFLQRPNAINTFQELLRNWKSSRITQSVLNAFLNLTKALQVRVSHYKNPCMHNSKEIMVTRVSSRCSSSNSTGRKTASGQSSDEFDRSVNIILLKKQQMTLPKYCFSTVKCVLDYLRSKNESMTHQRLQIQRNNLNTALMLLEELTILTSLVLNKKIWNIESDSEINEIFKQLTEVLISYSKTVDYFRLEDSSDDLNLENRVCYLCVLHNCKNFLAKIVPFSQSKTLLPQCLKLSLSQSIVDVILSKLYPETHKVLLGYVENFSSDLSLKKYHETDKVCESISCGVYFMKNCDNLNVTEAIGLVRKSLPSLEFHRDLHFVKQVIDLCGRNILRYIFDEEMLESFEYAILKLLAHNLDKIKEETYRLCHQKIITAIGPRSNSYGCSVPGGQVLFLLRSRILVEIACHGLTSDNLKIQNFSEDILIHAIKCKILVSEDVWNKIAEALITSLPILLCHANLDSSLGRLLFNIMDPETAEAMLIPTIQVIRGNIHLLFNNEPSIREEAFSRLCCLLASQKNSRDMIPRVNNLYDKALPHLCKVQRILDINKQKTSSNFYQASSLEQVLELLRSSNVEPVIRRSALTQISVMIEDPLLHKIFLEKNGIEIILNVMALALTEKNFKDYPDSVIPIINILKSVCVYNSITRRNLCEDSDVYLNILRGLFMYFTEERLRQDAICLLFILIFSDIICGSPLKCDFSIPHLVSEKIHVPFTCDSYGEISQYCDESRVDLIASDKWCLSSIQIQWNFESFGGFENLLQWNQIDYREQNVVDLLKLTDYDLDCLKNSSINYCIKKYLREIQNATTHEFVISNVQKLTIYIHLFTIANSNSKDTFFENPWERTFSKFFNSLPSSKEDVEILNSLLKFLQLLASLHGRSDNEFWLTNILKSPSTCLLDVLTVDSAVKEEYKLLNQNLLTLMSISATKQQHFLDFHNYILNSNDQTSSWNNIVQIIADNLNFNESTHFYNLSYLDSLLACLAHVTASLGWSNSKTNSPCKKLFSQLTSSLCELIVVFHCGKGATAAISVMGLSITRHALLILNHILAEIHCYKLKNWESCFFDVEKEGWLKSFFVLWFSRDVVLRAATLQFFAGLAVSERLALKIINEFKIEPQNIWNSSFNLLFDSDEANVVKEQCALFLGNLIKHDSNKTTIISLESKDAQKDREDSLYILKLLDDHQFFANLAPILSFLYTNQIISFERDIFELKKQSESRFLETPSNSSNSGDNFVVTTPSFARSLVLLVHNLIDIYGDKICAKLNDNGLIKLLFRCICNPTMSLGGDNKKMALYCEILEMDISICFLLSAVAKDNSICRGTILNTKDCLNTLLSLLNDKNYDTHYPQLLYLRNQLWSAIFRLCTVLLGVCDDSNINKHSQDALEIILETINDLGAVAFLKTLYEAIDSRTFIYLQSEALVALNSLTVVASQKIDSHSLQILFDTSYDDSDKTFGAEILTLLINLYSLTSLKGAKNKSLLVSTLAGTLSISKEAKFTALKSGFHHTIVKQLLDFQLKLSLESVECLKRVADKKRVCPLLVELNDLIGLITNFMVGDENVKNRFAECDLSDVIHKVWVWISTQKSYLVNALKMLVTFTANCTLACQSLPLTSSVAGTGPRKAASKYSLLHAIIDITEKETDQISKTHNLTVLELCLAIINNSCTILECRTLLCKSTLFNNVYRLHPAVTKRQRPFETVEGLWLEFFRIFSLYPEGQSHLAKNNDVFELLIALTNAKSGNGAAALQVLRNVAFYQSNRSRLLTSDDFLNVLRKKLESGSPEEKDTVVLILWSLAANNQKSKLIFKSAQLDTLLQQTLKHYELSSATVPESLERMNYVYNLIRDDAKC